jgi:hydrogenase-4 membrane subunit HyfE
MCFSPEADLVTGVFVLGVGVDALRHASRPQQTVLAAMPILLGAHQVDEAFVWWGLRGQVSYPVTHAAIYIFLTIAFALPFLVPLAVVAIEPARQRRRLMIPLLVVGALTTSVLLAAVVGGPVGATVDGHHIAYTADVQLGMLLPALYVVATCGSLIASSNQLLVLFGVGNIVAAAALAYLTFTGFTSLWCAWAAVTSVAIAVFMRRSEANIHRAALAS